METAHNLFSQPNKALGALFAFEVQQPETAESKLAGLKEFYSLPQITEPYFEEHQKNHHEAEKLLVQINELDENGKVDVLQAAHDMSAALWDALTGIHGESKVN